MKNNQTSQRIRYLVMLALFTAMAYVVMLAIHIKVGFLTLDVKDAVMTLCGLYFGPLSALIIAVVVPLLELATSDTGPYGLIMNILGSVSFSVVASLIYKYKKTLWGAIIGLISAAFTMVAVMMAANLLVTPHFMGVTVAAVREMIPTLLLPFNLLKALVNVGVVLLLYKTLSRALRRAKVLPKSNRPAQADAPAKRKPYVSVVIAVAALILIAASLAVIFTVLGGKIVLGS